MPSLQALNTTVLEIVEVLGPAEQGMSRPFRCRAEDGHVYYVKGQQTNRASLWREWICGHLALALDLPVPGFSLVQLNETLWQALPKDWQALGTLPAFGSRRLPHASWLELAMVGQVPLSLQKDVLVFDWWVRNTDRVVGNTNLLWDAQHECLAVIDHNEALNPAFNTAEFLANHVFSKQWDALAGDLMTQALYSQRLIDALPVAQAACQAAPQEWVWENSEFDVPAKFDPTAALDLLARCATPELWRTV